MIFKDNLVTHECDLSLGLQSSWDIHTLPFIFRHFLGGMVPSWGWWDSHRLNQHWCWGGSGSVGPSDVGSPLSDGSGLGGRGADDPLRRGRAAVRPGGWGVGMFYLPFARIWVCIIFNFITLEGKIVFSKDNGAFSPFFLLMIDFSWFF